MTRPVAVDLPHGAGNALSDAELEGLSPGSRVVVWRSIPAAADRPAQSLRWLVEVAEAHRWPGHDGWSLVPAWSQPPHRGDFHIGLTGHGMHTSVHRPAPDLPQ